MEIPARTRTSTVMLSGGRFHCFIQHLCVARNQSHSKKTGKGNKKHVEGRMMYECKNCGLWFFLEEGYEPETDRISCPACGHVIDENETEVQGK